MAKKNNSRKALAAALAVVGIAGLSIASASQLNINVTDDNIATGNQTVLAACDTDVNVAFGTEWNSTDKIYDIDAINVSDIAAGCDGLEIEIRAFDGATQLAIDTGSLDDSGTYSAAVTISGEDEITDISITIS